MSHLKIIPIGGMGNVTKNMFVYEYEDEMLLVDCGIGFPESSMLGVDVLIPDVTYIKDRIAQGARIVGMCLTHGHDDHIAALPYIIPQLPDFEIFGSELTAAFAQSRMEDFELNKRVNVVNMDHSLMLGVFTIDYIRLTHSVPQTTHLAIDTPEGIIYHGSDFKFDLTPVDGNPPDFGKIAEIGRRGVLCLLSDCLRVERTDWSPSEMILADAFEREIANCQGKFIVTLMSSNLHRISLLIDTAIAHGRKIVFIGRSIEQNVETAMRLGVITVPQAAIVHKKKMDQYQDEELCVVVAGSQGQPGSSLVRAVYGDHPILSVGKSDKVVFATEPIPGNEMNVYDAIDELSRRGIDAVYSDIDSGLHVSGHAGATEQKLLVALTKPEYLLPIGGSDRHRAAYQEMLGTMGYEKERVLRPIAGEIVEFSNGHMKRGELLTLKSMMVDGLGVGDVGNIVLADRKNMAEEGMVVVIVPQRSGVYETDQISIVSRGFVFMKQADEVINTIRSETKSIVDEGGEENEMKRKIEKRLYKKMNEVIGRTPLILPVFIAV